MSPRTVGDNCYAMHLNKQYGHWQALLIFWDRNAIKGDRKS